MYAVKAAKVYIKVFYSLPIISLVFWEGSCLNSTPMLAAQESLSQDFVVDNFLAWEAQALTKTTQDGSGTNGTRSHLIASDYPVTELEESDFYSDINTDAANPISEINSVTELSDVQPTDWAFQALQSLISQ